MRDVALQSYLSFSDVELCYGTSVVLEARKYATLRRVRDVLCFIIVVQLRHVVFGLFSTPPHLREAPVIFGCEAVHYSPVWGVLVRNILCVYVVYEV